MTPSQFQSRLTQIEDDTIAAIEREYRQTRFEILGAITDLGADNPALFDQIRVILAQLSIKLIEVGVALVDSLRPAMEDYARQQFEGLGLEGLDFDQYWAETEAEREGILNSIHNRLLDAVSTIQARFHSALVDMQQAKEEGGAIALRLAALLPVDGRVSEWRHGRNLLDSEIQKAIWGTAMAGVMLIFLLLNSRLKEQGVKVKGKQARIVKTAIATLDKRTTQTCFRVDGQVQPVNKPFKLTGTPRYANEKMLNPFHDYCRTVVEVSLKK